MGISARKAQGSSPTARRRSHTGRSSKVRKSTNLKASAETSSLATEAYGIVRQRIAHGQLGLGHVISRRKLAVELGMSLLPVSMALLRLELEGLLESRPRAGTRVRIPSPEDVRGHYVVREALEVHAAKLFAEVATPQERRELQELAARVDAVSVQSDQALYLRLHQKLHRRIAEHTRCVALSAAIEQVQALATTWLWATRRPSFDYVHTHQDLIRVLISGNPEHAAEAMRQHIAVNVQKMLDLMKPYFRLRKTRGKRFYRSDKQRQTA